MNPEICLEIRDDTEADFPAAQFLGATARDAEAQAARLAEQFIRQNRQIFAAMDVQATCRYDGRHALIRLTSGATVGAVPLSSPTSARPDFGLVIQPRFRWKGIGGMLGEMGWRVVPSALRLPLMRRSERRVPAWVLAAMILARLEVLLRHVVPRFEVVQATRAAPRGAVRWAEYAARQLPRGRALQVPCSYPELTADSTLLGAIRFALEKQRGALEGQAAAGIFVLGLIERCEMLLGAVRGVAPVRPKPLAFYGWLHRPIRAAQLIEGIEAIQWTAEDRGLAGLSDLDGVPWRMNMSAFFEAYVEALASRIALRLGARLRAGRLRQTVHPIHWDRPSAGSQSSLVPDIVLEWPDATVIVDAKYKRHWEALHRIGWRDFGREERDRHRADLLQALAYANLPRTRRVIVCLAYPCGESSWQGAAASGLPVMKAHITGGARNLELWLVATPMGLPLAKAAAPIEAALRNTLAR